MINKIRFSVLSSIIYSNLIFSNPVYTNFKKYMENSIGSFFRVEYGHSQFGESISEKGEIYFKSHDNIIFDNTDQRIFYTKNFIKTINKKNKQIIYDEPLVDELTIFDFIFSGNYANQFNEILSDSIYSTFNFDLESFGYTGSLKVHNISGQPKKISIKGYNSDSIIYIIFESTLEIQSFKTDTLDTLGYDFIDFRE